eukprot:1175496-Prorocentrum_minimum.AAC.4
MTNKSPGLTSSSRVFKGFLTHTTWANTLLTVNSILKPPSRLLTVEKNVDNYLRCCANRQLRVDGRDVNVVEGNREAPCVSPVALGSTSRQRPRQTPAAGLGRGLG